MNVAEKKSHGSSVFRCSVLVASNWSTSGIGDRAPARASTHGVLAAHTDFPKDCSRTESFKLREQVSDVENGAAQRTWQELRELVRPPQPGAPSDRFAARPGGSSSGQW